MLTTSLQKSSLNLSHSLILTSLFTLIILGGFLRFYNLSSQSYWMDEGYTVNAVMSISEHGSTILDSGQNYSCPTYCYPTALFVKILGNDPGTYRLLSVIVGLIFIVAIFFIVRKLFDKNIALLSSFFITFSYWQIAWSRQARWYTLFALFFWLAIYFFYQAIYSEKKRYVNILLTTTFSVLAILTHGLGYLLPIIFIGWILLDQVFIQRNFNWKKNLLVLAGGTIVLYIFNLISNIDIIGYLLNTFKLHYVLPYYLNFYLRNYWLFIVLALVAIFSNNKSYRKEIYFLLFTFLIYFIPLSLFTDIVQYRYMFHLTPIFFILGSMGVFQLHNDIKSLYGKVILWIVVVGLFATIAGGVFIPKTNYYLESDNPSTLGDRPYYAYTPQPNWSGAYGFIKANSNADSKIISSHPHFNKIFLGQAGYWIKYNYLGFDNKAEYSKDNKEFYVGAEIINNIDKLKTIVTNSNGYIVFDYMATDGRILPEIIDYIETNLDLVFHDFTNSYSEVWVYKF